MAYDFTEILAAAAKQEYYEIPVNKESLIFLVKQGKGTIAAKINEILSDEGTIKLPKMGDLSVKEHLGFRNDRINDARRKELIAQIGVEKKCSKDAAEKSFTDMASWKSLSTELHDNLLQYYTAALAETVEQSLPSRQITTIIQERLIKDWKLEWTLLLPQSILEPLITYFEGEATNWESEKDEDEIFGQTIDVEVKNNDDPLNGSLARSKERKISGTAK